MVSLWPYVVPRHITIWDGAADPQTLMFAGVGIAIVIPIVLAYRPMLTGCFAARLEHPTSRVTQLSQRGGICSKKRSRSRCMVMNLEPHFYVDRR